MNGRQLALGVLFADFAALNLYVVYRHGLGFLELVTANVATTAVLVDLAIALGMVTVWMFRDARERGWNALPYALVTLVFGSCGPLLYLIRRAGAEERRPTAGVAHAARA
jgi:hypothetical protein